MIYYIERMAAVSVLKEEAVEIAWAYLERSDRIVDAEFCSHVLLHSVETMIRQGVRNRLLLSNRAIAEYLRELEARTLQAVCSKRSMSMVMGLNVTTPVAS